MDLSKKALQDIGTLIDQKLKLIKKSLRELKTTLDLHVRDTDRLLNYHHRRIQQVEEKAGVKPPEFFKKVH